MATPDLLIDLLKNVSRSFYLTVRVLPAAIRPQIGLAYLLARATDTIADTEIIPVAGRLEALNQLRKRILGDAVEELDFASFTAGEASSAAERAEAVLLGRIEEAIQALNGFVPEDQRRIREVLEVITSGQELDLRRFGAVATRTGGQAPAVTALATEVDLDDYTYRVAGCVGEFWTKMCRAHLFPSAEVDEAVLLANAVRFGKGLQLVNILRDLPKDLRLGRCYLPSTRLAESGLTPADLLVVANEPRVRPLYEAHLDLAQAHLAAGWAYTNALPRGCVRVRLACAWPVLIGVKTIGRLREGRFLDATRRIKITRAEVRGIMVRSLARYPFARAWGRQFEQAASG
ncbi:MAG: squalene/phytoene synthase family protein [Verrucomicrobia bacterium]|nr:squalene/phytoene synthase family protein [Verrucomicrobiota bacterium]